MIKVDVKLNDVNIPYEFVIAGHALYDNKGKDIVCAGVSTLAITIANSMTINCKNEVEVDVNDKNTTISIKIPKLKNNNASCEVQVLAKTLLLGLKSIEEEYGDKYISVKEEKTDD